MKLTPAHRFALFAVDAELWFWRNSTTVLFVLAVGVGVFAFWRQANEAEALAVSHQEHIAALEQRHQTETALLIEAKLAADQAVRDTWEAMTAIPSETILDCTIIFPPFR